ncbi:hypothetical protein ACJMK2_039679 [Sinanodonta woodiana]|uniref:Uncharacterized protein n=1 Tax=Sinanodonta woodiana TaxID=1069815 RepID=A0ABD3WDX7_SINWO
MKNLEEKSIILNIENKKLRKRNERLKKVKQSVQGKETSASKAQFNSTPKSKANAEIRELGLTPRKVPNSVKRKLIMANAMIAEIQATKEKNKPQKQSCCKYCKWKYPTKVQVYRYVK